MVEGIAAERRSPFGDNPTVGPRGARTQRRILTAALEVFAAHGYHDSRIEQITEAAGCSRPTFYQYFSSKEDVFRALASYVGREVVRMVEGLGPITPDEAGRQVVTGWMSDLSDFYDAHAPVFSSFAAAVRSDAGLVAGSATVSAGFGKALRSRLVLDSADLDAAVLASNVVTMIVRANLLRVGSAGLIARRRFVEALAGVVHRVLLGPSAILRSDAVPTRTRVPARLRVPPPVRDRDEEPARPLSPQGVGMRNRLIEAGLVVFPLRGFHDTRVDDVVAAAGASHGSFYRYFESKDDLFGVLAADAAGELISCIGALPTGDDPATLTSWLDGWFDLYARHGAIIALWREAQFTDAALTELTRTVADAALGRLLTVMGERGVGDALVNAICFLGLIETVPHHVEAFGYFNREAAIAALVAIIRRGFLGLDLAP